MGNKLHEQSEVTSLLSYVDANQRETLNETAFAEISGVFMRFLDRYKTNAELVSDVTQRVDDHVVCNARPGTGKTTALIAFIKMLASNNTATVPVLIALKDTELAKTMFEKLKHLNTSGRKFILNIDAGNKEMYKDSEIRSYQVLIIQHQRLRNLTLELGNITPYISWLPNMTGKSQQRILIIDEMPVFHESAIFDVGDIDNCVGWFDKIVASSSATSHEKQAVRSGISTMIAMETSDNQTSLTRALVRHVGETFLPIYQRLTNELNTGEFDAILKYYWLKKLMFEDGTGRISDDDSGRKIICSQRVDYRGLGLPILILDGTADNAPLQYNGEYQIWKVSNQNNYDRLNVRQLIINTSRSSRNKKDKSVQKTIADYVNKLRIAGNSPFPLVAKSDVEIYMQLGVIDAQYAKWYETKATDDESNELAINILNTTGKNHLQNETKMILTNLPIMQPDFYRQKAIALYGDKVGLELAENGEGGWFKDPDLEKLYIECVVVELLQIVHRTKLRHIDSDERIDIYICTNNSTTLSHLYEALGLINSNTHEEALANISLYGYEEKFNALAQELTQYGELRNCFPCKLSSIFNSRSNKYENICNYHNGKTREAFCGVLKLHGIVIYEKQDGRRTYKYVDWVDGHKNKLEF